MAENNSDKRTVVVNIGGKDFKIKGDAGEDFLRKLAAYVDGKIKEIKDKTDIVDMQSLAVLASLNIAEELHNLREEKSQAETQTAEQDQAKAQAAQKELEEKLREMTAEVDKYLE